MDLSTLRTFIAEAPEFRSLLATGRHLFWSNSRVVEKRDLEYGPRDRQKLDVYEPAEIDEETEAIVFLHGGGWESGNKGIHRFVGRAWARRNFALVLPNYRLAPEATYPAQVRDVAGSIRWLGDNYEGLSERFYLAGHSAGAHLASLVGFSEEWREEAGLRPEGLKGLILLSGVYQFYPFERADPRVKGFVGGRRYWEEAQPLNHLKGALPPVFMAHGSDDSEVLPEQSRVLKEELEKLDVRSELLLDEGAGHIGLLLNTTRKDGKFWRLLERFFR